MNRQIKHRNIDYIFHFACKLYSLFYLAYDGYNNYKFCLKSKSFSTFLLFSTHISFQWRACIDEKIYATFWTKHVVHGQSIKFRDKESGRPTFRVDTRGYDFGEGQRFFELFTGEKVSE